MKKKRFDLSQQDLPRIPKNPDTRLPEEVINEINALKGMKPDLSDPDAPEIQRWDHAVVGKFYRPIKKQITIRLDADILDWFKQATSKYQTLINNACREYMQKKRRKK